MNIVIATRSRYPHGPTPQRLDLTRNITVPSLIGQTDRAFTWLVSVSDSDHAGWLSDEVGSAFGLWLRPNADFSIIGDDTRMIRLDDDDAIACDFVERLRSAGPHKPGTWYQFPNGFRSCQGRCEPYHNPTNQFIAFDIPNGSRRHVYEINHTKLGEQCDVVEVDVKPAWLWTRHSESKSTGGRQPTHFSIDGLKQFAIDHEFLKGVR